MTVIRAAEGERNIDHPLLIDMPVNICKQSRLDRAGHLVNAACMFQFDYICIPSNLYLNLFYWARSCSCRPAQFWSISLDCHGRGFPGKDHAQLFPGREHHIVYENDTNRVNMVGFTTSDAGHQSPESNEPRKVTPRKNCAVILIFLHFGTASARCSSLSRIFISACQNLMKIKIQTEIA